MNSVIYYCLTLCVVMVAIAWDDGTLSKDLVFRAVLFPVQVITILVMSTLLAVVFIAGYLWWTLIGVNLE